MITTGALTSGATNVSTPAKSAEVTETDAVLAVKELTPKRAQHGFSYTLEDAATYPGLILGSGGTCVKGCETRLTSKS